MEIRIIVLLGAALLASCAPQTISVHELSDGQPIEVSSPSWVQGSPVSVRPDK